MSIRNDVQKLEPGQLVELFVLDLTSIVAGVVYRFHAGKDNNIQNITFQGNVYTAWPVEAEGFELNGQGNLPRPRIRIGNKDGFISAIVATARDLVGAKLTRKRTFARYLDGQPLADSTAEFPQDIYFFARKTQENKILVEWELSSALDLSRIQLPVRIVTPNSCPWEYKGAECGYVPGLMFDVGDEPVFNSDEDVCGKRLSSCEKRFGANNPLPFGGFPSVGRFG